MARSRDARPAGPAGPLPESADVESFDPRTGIEAAGLLRPVYAAGLIERWLPALDEVVGKLGDGAGVVDLTCGAGAATVAMARAFERSSFLGLDDRAGCIAVARAAAESAGVGHRTRFEVATVVLVRGQGYDLACFYDDLHGSIDPLELVRGIRQALACDGTLLLVEPDLGGAANPAGRSRLDGVERGPGTEPRLRSLLAAGGFRHVRPIARTRFLSVLEARP